MAIDKNKNDRVSLTIEKELKEQCKELAELESRSLNSFIINAIKEYIKNNHKE
ncbi:Arc family DNA-binding protein [Clostridium disporicum]|uniref:Arc-like DNA binding domain-containing protein n=1 Tax=Clostridium disporicum TaxID=84024 RepID=A0A174DN54_9CLOT|nr:Arc family DNA-binding protein [Clostridium disporicum]CUO26913.1 Uncharacterised protein [Clostridium disporicum]